ncbi:MAG: zinc chelation protein SecC [Hyphomicrobiales bacterium]|nr:MAG: zinc chelation protein SecC [Hyphomicrobiales bacterium]
MSRPCPCGSGMPLESCCGRFLSGATGAATAEELMRSRYTAHVLGNVGYLKNTLWPAYQKAFDAIAVGAFASGNRWIGLSVLETEDGGADDATGTVLFEARFLAGTDMGVHRELSLFRKKGGRWYYVEGLPEGGKMRRI